MNDPQEEILAIFRRTGALLEGHFILRSGLHSPNYFQCARVCQFLPEVGRLASFLLDKLGDRPFQTVLAPAMGALVIGQEVARQSGARYLFAEKEEGALKLRRGFTFEPGEQVLVVEDVVTRGGRAQESLSLVREAGGEPVALAVLVDRSAGQARFDLPMVSLLELDFPTYPPDQLPPELAAIPATKPGS